MTSDKNWSQDKSEILEMKALTLILTTILIIVIIWLVAVVKYRSKDKSSRPADTRTLHTRVKQNAKIDSKKEEAKVCLSYDDEKILAKKYPKPGTVPTFARNFNSTDQSYEVAGYRFEVNSTGLGSLNLPKSFMAFKEWSGMITGVFDQERCGSCWAFAVCSAMTDRIRIKSKGQLLKNGDYLSPFHLAACMKCGKDNACPRVCEGNYLDDVFQYCVDVGAIAQSDIDANSDQGYEYRCFDYEAKGVKPWKGLRKYRVNIFPPGQLTNEKNLRLNETAIMEEIYKNGPVACIVKVYAPKDKRNFYIHKEGIYGYGWKSEPEETDGYHAITIVGWGSQEMAKPDGTTETVKYWVVRNSWGPSWGSSNGMARFLKGQNFGYIEADCWGIDVNVDV